MGQQKLISVADISAVNGGTFAMPLSAQIVTLHDYDRKAPPPILEEKLSQIPPSLQPFLKSCSIDEMKSTLIDSDRHWLTTQALPDLYDHIRAVRDEFTGSPEINFYHAALIIKIRRKIDLVESLNAFQSLWKSEKLTLIKTLNSRWLMSALDTFVDHGKAQEKSSAMIIVTFINMLKIADTEYSLTGAQAYMPEKLNENVTQYPELWDGIRVFHLPDDDTFKNMIGRMRGMLQPTPLFALIFEFLLAKITTQNTILSRLAQHHMRNLW